MVNRKLALMGVSLDDSPSNPYRFIFLIYPSVNCSGLNESSLYGSGGSPIRLQYGGNGGFFKTAILMAQLGENLGMSRSSILGTNSANPPPPLLNTANGEDGRACLVARCRHLNAAELVLLMEYPNGTF